MNGTRKRADFIAFVVALVLLYEPFKRLARTNYTIQIGLGGADRIFGLLDTQPQVVDRPGARELRGVRQGVEFHDVSFAYEPGGEVVLRHIDLHIAAGEVV